MTGNRRSIGAGSLRAHSLARGQQLRLADRRGLRVDTGWQEEVQGKVFASVDAGLHDDRDRTYGGPSSNCTVTCI